MHREQQDQKQNEEMNEVEQRRGGSFKFFGKVAGLQAAEVLILDEFINLQLLADKFFGYSIGFTLLFINCWIVSQFFTKNEE